MEKDFKKINRYNTKGNFWASWNSLDRIRIFFIPKNKGDRQHSYIIRQKNYDNFKNIIEKEIHYHIYQGPKEKVDEFLTFCENNNIKFREGIGINLKEKYDKIRDKNIRELLKL